MRPVHVPFFSLLLLSLVALLAACPPGSSQPDDDDDDAADDDDSFSGETASYPDEEEFLGLAVGNTWRYDEVVSGGPTPEEDDVMVEIVARIAGPDLTPPRSNNVVAFEFEIDRLFGRDESHWYSIDGSGTMRWLQSSITQDFFETTEYPGDTGIVMWSAADELGVIGSDMDSVWFVADIEGIDYRSEASTVETYMYGDNAEVETVGLVIYEVESEAMVGLQYFKPTWGLLGLSLDAGSVSTSWSITECSICPASSGL